MIRKIEDFLECWSKESAATLKVLNAITDDVVNKPVIGYNRTLGFLAWHLITSIVDMANGTGLKVEGPSGCNSEVLPSKKISEIADIYKKVSDTFLNEIKTKWNDDSLNIEVDMYGEKWKNGATLLVILSHEIHHRGQMTVLMRVLGLKTVPGVCGPSKEEWSAIGMKEQP
jgi:uncharacterized damage-inducible protein DinB